MNDQVLSLLPCSNVEIIQGLPDDVSDRHLGIQGPVRILVDDLHLSPAILQLPPVQLTDVVPLQPDLTRGWLDETEEGSPRGGFPASALSHKPQCFPLLQSKADTIQGINHFPPF